MDIIPHLEQYYRASPLAFLKAVPLRDVKFDPRSKYKCKYGCKNYDRKYSCPPASLEFVPKIESSYKWAILFATSESVPDSFSQYRLRAFNIQREIEIQRLTNQLGDLLSSHGIPNLPLSGGSCKHCRQCSMLTGKPCKKPLLRQISMESVGIDCQKTMHNAGFDFQMPNRGSVNRCGCILANDPSISAISLNGRKSHQEFIQPNENQVNAMCDRLAHEYSDLFLSARVIRISDIVLRSPICHECRDIKQNISCPPYSGLIDLNFWQFAVVWHWRPNRFKKTRYNVALKTLHAALFSLGFYFALSIRDCYCDECTFCSASAVEQPSCPSRKIMAPSMQSQGIDHHQFGEGRFGVELL